MSIIISFMISLISIVISFGAFYSGYYYSNLEYEYKLDPEIDVEGYMGVRIEPQEGEKNIVLDTSGLEVKIMQNHNLQVAYLIDSDYTVTKLKLDEMEERLKSGWQEHLKKEEYDLTVNGVNYVYEFILLKGLDDSYELYLMYSRDGRDNQFGASLVSGIEVVELEKAHRNEVNYAGERELAKKYQEVLEDCGKYIIQ